MMNKTETHYKKALQRLTADVQAFERSMDELMKQPPTLERGKKIAEQMNMLSMANQSAMHFTLGYSFEKINKR